MTKSLICICCPQGCHLTAEKNADSAKIVVVGNRCPRGEKYAQEELTDPRRVVTAVVKTSNGSLPYLPVRTDRAISRKIIGNLLNKLYKMSVTLPIKRGTVILNDIEGTGVSVIASEDAQ